jgi:hypothetical protein
MPQIASLLEQVSAHLETRFKYLNMTVSGRQWIAPISITAFSVPNASIA